MKPLNPQLLREFIRRAGDRLQGEWLLVGGTLLPAVGLDIRSTVDIDLIGLGEKENSQSLALMDLSASLELPIETANQTAAFFLKKISYGKTDLLPLLKGKTAIIYRPSVLLYWKLKIERLSETDVLDCQHYYNFCSGQKDIVNKSDLKHLLDNSLKNPMSPEKTKRLKSLKTLL